MSWEIRCGDCVEVMRSMEECSVHAVVTDPPYGIRFMGQAWDGEDIEKSARAGMRKDTVRPDGWAKHYSPAMAAGRYDFTRAGTFAFQMWSYDWAVEALRVLKPGGHLLAFGGTRTFHRLTCAIEDAGFEVRDCMMWLYGSGFPKSLDVGKAIDKAAGAERDKVPPVNHPGYQRRIGNRRPYMDDPGHRLDSSEPVTDAAKEWDGWGTALKPAWEPIVVARKPLIGTVAENVLEHGTGALDIDGSRISHTDDADLATSQSKNPGRTDSVTSGVYGANRPQQRVNTAGRWPANVVLDEEAAAMLDAQSGERRGFSSGGQSGRGFRTEYVGGEDQGWKAEPSYFADSGGASRFYYTAKASKSDRGEWNDHPTVKPTDLMRWLVGLVTREGQTVLDPFAGSGTTIAVAEAMGRNAIGIEQNAEDVRKIIDHRMPTVPLIRQEYLNEAIEDGPDLFGEQSV